MRYSHKWWTWRWGLYWQQTACDSTVLHYTCVFGAPMLWSIRRWRTRIWWVSWQLKCWILLGRRCVWTEICDMRLRTEQLKQTLFWRSDELCWCHHGSRGNCAWTSWSWHCDRLFRGARACGRWWKLKGSRFRVGVREWWQTWLVFLPPPLPLLGGGTWISVAQIWTPLDREVQDEFVGSYQGPISSHKLTANVIVIKHRRVWAMSLHFFFKKTSTSHERRWAQATVCSRVWRDLARSCRCKMSMQLEKCLSCSIINISCQASCQDLHHAIFWECPL